MFSYSRTEGWFSSFSYIWGLISWAISGRMRCWNTKQFYQSWERSIIFPCQYSFAPLYRQWLNTRQGWLFNKRQEESTSQSLLFFTLLLTPPTTAGVIVVEHLQENLLIRLLHNSAGFSANLSTLIDNKSQHLTLTTKWALSGTFNTGLLVVELTSLGTKLDD